jgi:hypothetical protein
MKIAKLFFPGAYEDAYVYMGRLFILTERRTILTYDLEKLVNSTEQLFGSLPIPTYLFSRNDWLSNDQSKSLLRNSDVYRALWVTAFQKFPQPFLEVGGGDFFLGEQELDISDPVILDILIYNRRLYLGATNGFYHVDLIWDEKGPITLEKSQKKTDTRCLNTSAKYGTVNASCNEEGLIAFVDDFNWRKQGKGSIKYPLADKSRRTSWLGPHIVNYSDHNRLNLFKSSSEQTAEAESEGKVLTAIESKGQDLSYLFEEAQARYNIPMEEIQFTFNSNTRLFLHTNTGLLHSIQLSSPDNDGKIRLGKDEKSKESIGRILSINSTKLGPVVETSDRVALVGKNGQFFTLSEAGALMVRTFPNSKRFRNLVAITDESGVFLVGLFDESEFERKLPHAPLFGEDPALNEDHPF